MEIVEKIRELKKKRNAVILVHNYQIPEVHDIGDYVGDSLGLSIEAAKTDADAIVFCGVYFMAETAKILSPGKTVVIPDKNAGCPMANMINGEQLRKLKAQHPQAKVLCYVNTTAEVKAESDLCCTSANAVAMVEKVLKDEKEIIFVPDKHLADFVSEKTGRTFIAWDGYCPTHAKILPEELLEQKRLHPAAKVIAHPECPRPIRHLSDVVVSTEGMCRYVKEAPEKEIIVATEKGIIHRLQKENPGKIFYPVTDRTICPNMKLITLEKVLWALEDMRHQVEVPPSIAEKARQAIERMLNYTE
ncbi:MAG TPA: quinolinate synthase NadA [Syntrophales bacterium]|nr:quinolinate synthase NadA [Syntrophales bacterium]